MWLRKRGSSPRARRAPRLGQQRAQEAIERGGGTVVGVQADQDRAALAHQPGVLGQGTSAEGRVLSRTGGVGPAAHGDLHDPVRAGLSEAAQGGVEALRRGDVDRREGVAPIPGRVEHLRVLGRGGDRHGIPLGGLGRRLAADEGAQARVVLPAGRAAGQVRLHPGDGRIRVVAGELEIDVAVQLFEALLAADLRAGPARAAAAAPE